jgi:hypothetical protein
MNGYAPCWAPLCGASRAGDLARWRWPIGAPALAGDLSKLSASRVASRWACGIAAQNGDEPIAGAGRRDRHRWREEPVVASVDGEQRAHPPRSLASSVGIGLVSWVAREMSHPYTATPTAPRRGDCPYGQGISAGDHHVLPRATAAEPAEELRSPRAKHAGRVGRRRSARGRAVQVGIEASVWVERLVDVVQPRAQIPVHAGRPSG